MRLEFIWYAVLNWCFANMVDSDLYVLSLLIPRTLPID